MAKPDRFAKKSRKSQTGANENQSNLIPAFLQPSMVALSHILD